MSRTKLGILAGTALGGGLLLAVSGSVLAEAPLAQPSATPSGAYGPMGMGMMATGGGMMGGYRTAAPAPTVTVAPDATTLPAAAPTPATRPGTTMMGGGMMGSGVMDRDDAQQMLDWMNQAGPQVRAMHDAMAKSDCSTDVMKQFVASPAPTRR